MDGAGFKCTITKRAMTNLTRQFLVDGGCWNLSFNQVLADKFYIESKRRFTTCIFYARGGCL